MPIRMVLFACCLMLAPLSLSYAQEEDTNLRLWNAPDMPEGFAKLRVRALSRSGQALSGYLIRFEKSNLGNMEVRLDLSRLKAPKSTVGSLGCRYFKPSGVLHRDERSQADFSFVIEDLNITEESQLSRVLIEGSPSFFSLGFHRVEIFWKDKDEGKWRPAGSLLFEIVW